MKKGLTALFLVMVLLLTGCGGTFETSENAIYVKGNGSILAASIESFDKEYYSEDGLKQYIENQITKYTDKNGKKSVQMTKFQIQDQKAQLFMKYRDAKAYQGFCGEEFFCGTLPEAMAAGYDFEGTFQKIKDGKIISKDITRDDFLDKADLKVVITGEKLDVKVDGDICFLSEGLQCKDNHTAGLMDHQEEMISQGLQIVIYE